MTEEDFEELYRNREPIPSDFDGHSDFHLLSYEQRLMWLSEMQEIIRWAREIRKKTIESQHDDQHISL